jgi:glycerate kinase
MSLLVCANAFKGTLSARAVCRALARGVARTRPSLAVSCLPVADGGDGTAAVLARALGGRPLRFWVSGPLGKPATAHAYLFDGPAIRAALDLATACGMRRLPAGRPRPLDASTQGLGQLIGAVAALGGEATVLVGLGGSASTDGGAGALAALGFRLLDRLGRPIPPGGRGLARLARIVPPEPPPALRLSLLTDVASPLLGPDGAARRFAPQKGATGAEVAFLEAGLDRLRRRMEADLGTPPALAGLAGAGAAGGTAYGLAAGLGARIVPGASEVLERIGFPQHAAAAHAFLTGEGRLDATTALGKAPAEVARRAAALAPGAPVFAACAQTTAPRVAGLTALAVPASRDGLPLSGEDLARAAARWAAAGLFDPA